MPRRPRGPSPPEPHEEPSAAPPPGLAAKLAELIAAAFPGVLVVGPEPEEVLRDLAGLCREKGWNLATWTADGGEDGPADPLAAVKALPASGDGETPSLLAMVHPQRYLNSPELLAAIRSALAAGKTRRTCLILVQPIGDLPPELGRDFAVLDCPLPSRAELEAVARGVATEAGELPDPLTPVLDAAAGLTRSEAENAFALSLVRHGRLDPGPLWELKAKQLSSGGPLSLSRGGPGFEALGGMEALKTFCGSVLRKIRPTAEAKGVLLLGPGGVGKSSFARALGREVERPTLTLDVGGLMGSLVGQTEHQTRQALATVEAMAPCVLFVDEVERALAGTSGGAPDSGVSSRLLGTLLSWLADRPPGVFVVCTANDASRLPPELTRSGRFDATFFLDLPGPEQRAGIWETYRERYGVAAGDATPADAGWTGAEIESCCRLSALLGVSLDEAATHVVPVSVSAAEPLAKLRRWASGRCLDAEAGGVFRPGDGDPSGDAPRRRTSRPAKQNYSLN
ncbi:ATP-binding protein [Alienimonas californiensis]|uniref:Uncharacterized AAA domain-containing protein ycf46 n=1 Tax=Alienimonas californiensis TaxID=2527989 RepID=A0A517P4A8_9PLAN|nr:ATP-binding protein [Alienimonas californiensis]QDT14209.1 ATP-dependent zinc metalloprotease FtsH [Alienimonas californiensis]